MVSRYKDDDPGEAEAEFDFEAWALKSEDLQEEKTHFFIKGFLVEQAITMFYGKEKQGKSWLLYAITKLLCEHDGVKKVFYVDQDNPKRQLKERKIDELIDAYSDKLKYMARGSTPYQGLELVEKLTEPATMNAYEGCIFIYDSTRDFVSNTDSDIQAKRFMENMKKIREAGGTVLLIHHATKSGKVIDGSAEFTKSADNVFETIQRGKEDDLIQFDLPVYRDRDAIKDMLLSVNTKTLDLVIDDDYYAGLKKEDEAFVMQVCDLLARSPAGQNKSGVLTECGYRRDDKTKGKLLEAYVDRFWVLETIRNKKIFKLITKEGL